jgi:agmatinase
MPQFSPLAEGFLGLKKQLAPKNAPLVRVIPFGLEATVSYGGGAAHGPAAMIAASREVELFDESWWREPVRSFRIETLKEPEIPGRIEDALDLLAALTEEALRHDAFPFVFGGEHSITPGAIRPFLARYPDLVLLHFDAHADLRDGYAGAHYSHASAIRRCLDAPALGVVSVGVRNISAEEALFYEDNRGRIHIHWAKDKASWRVDDIIAPLRGRPIYVTFDVDAFDSSLMPATGTPEPGGLFWDDVTPIIRHASKAGHFVGADINELAPRADNHAPDFAAAKLAYKILAARFCGDANKR